MSVAGKLEYLEGIRGIAAAQVFFCHWRDFAPSFIEPFIMFEQSNVWAVAMFYILSGRIITLRALRREDFKAISSSAVRRPFRLWIPLVGIMIFNWLLYTIGLLQFAEPDHFIIRNFFEVAVYPLGIVTMGFSVQDPSPNPAWTLYGEFIGSLVIYIISVVLLDFETGSRGRWLILLSVFSWNVWCTQWIAHFIYGLMLTELDLMGVLSKYSRWKWSFLINCMIIAVLIFFFLESQFGYGTELGTFLRSIQLSDGKFGVEKVFWRADVNILIICSAIMFIVETTPVVKRALSTTFIVFLGRISFSLYLFHYTLICKTFPNCR